MGCPLYGDGKGFVPDEIIPGATTFILGQNPGADEESKGVPFVGDTGTTMMKDFFPVAELHRGRNVSIGNLLKCRWNHTNDMPSGETLRQAIEQCTTHYLEIPEHTELVIAQGAHAWRSCGGVGSIYDWRGYILPDQDQPMVYGVLHLADLNHDPKMRLPALMDWARIPRILRGEWPQPRPRPIPSTTPVGPIALDTEYYPDTGKLRTFSIAGRDHTGQVFGEIDPPIYRVMDLAQHQPFIFQNALADLYILHRNFGLTMVDFPRGIEDTMLAHAALWSELPHNLEFLASLYSPYGKAKHLRHEEGKLQEYNWGDTTDTLMVWEGLAKELERHPDSQRVYREQSLRLLPLLLDARIKGIRINTPRVESAARDLHQELERATMLAQASVGFPLNLGSHKQLVAYLYGVEGMSVQKGKKGKGKRKTPTINDDAIATLRAHYLPFSPEEEQKEPLTSRQAYERVGQGAHPVLEARAVYSHVLQTESHYIRPALGKERFYPSIAIHAQETGRWSISDPPLAQLPPKLRNIIIPDPEETWLAWDWDQIELRLLAAIAGDTPLLKAFEKGWDIHTLNCCDIFGWEHPPDRTDPHTAPGSGEWRDLHKWEGKEDPRRVFAKRFVYRLNYGGDPARAGDIPGARLLGLGPKELIQASNLFLFAHPNLNQWRQEVRQTILATPHPESKTWFGRRRRFLASRGEGIVREAYNNPMQAGVADVLNLTLIKLHDRLPQMRLIYTMHDSGCISVPKPEWNESLRVMKEVLATQWPIGPGVVFPATIQTPKHG